MARARLVSPKFFTHAELYDAEARSSLPLRVAFAGLWTQADRRGVFEWRPRELKLAILPYDAAGFDQVLEALRAAGFIVRYEAGGRVYGFIPSFLRWQHPHVNERPSDAPEPPRHHASTVPAPCHSGASTSESVADTESVTKAESVGRDLSEGEPRPHPDVENSSATATAPLVADATRNGNGGTAPLPFHAVKLVRSCYGAAPEKRQRDVKRQLTDTLGRGAVFERGLRVQAVDADHLDDACRRVLADPPRKPDAAIRLVLLKLRESYGETNAARQKAGHAEPPRRRAEGSGPTPVGDVVRATA